MKKLEVAPPTNQDFMYRDCMDKIKRYRERVDKEKWRKKTIQTENIQTQLTNEMLQKKIKELVEVKNKFKSDLIEEVQLEKDYT